MGSDAVLLLPAMSGAPNNPGAVSRIHAVELNSEFNHIDTLKAAGHSPSCGNDKKGDGKWGAEPAIASPAMRVER